ncbi:hypothetical protein ACN6LA_003093 [Streptomyces sp. SAS_269]|uniref:hypothetical protein n=1 Tax=Streptomyces sp. SAS_269 TaxID=3412749 RepID=UPI00403D2003
MTSPRTDLSAFAAGLAARLPGTWASEYQRHAQYADQFPRTEQLWDAATSTTSSASTSSPTTPCSTGRPTSGCTWPTGPVYPHQFVVAPLAPDGPHIKPHHFDAVEEPNGIAVAKDPARAAAHVARRVLPRYEQALQEVFDNAAARPDPPHRPGPPQVDQVLTLTLYSDGALGAPYESVPVDARMTLYAHGFQYPPHQAAFLLPTAYGDSGRALRIHGVVQQLTAKGIGVNLRHSAPTTSAALPPTSPKTAPTTSRTR